ncbi:MAG TPA: hypothetical protein VLE73_04525 [Candidatus Saccharimonadales bacterium]|nr:hypothetical protein [Candidatus Saccharimonadales bacterium]
MADFDFSQKHINLHIPTRSGRERLAHAPETWANTVVAAAIETKIYPDIQAKLHAGNLAIGVIFGPDDLQQAAGSATIHAICGDLRVSAGELKISQSSLGRNPVYDTFTFRRASAEQPYIPASHQRNNNRPTNFPEDPSEDFPAAMATGLEIMRAGAQTVQHRLVLPKGHRNRYAPFVRIIN